jgi:hypothetical protein
MLQQQQRQKTKILSSFQLTFKKLKKHLFSISKIVAKVMHFFFIAMLFLIFFYKKQVFFQHTPHTPCKAVFSRVFF